jgi:hypothetical protein
MILMKCQARAAERRLEAVGERPADAERPQDYRAGGAGPHPRHSHRPARLPGRVVPAQPPPTQRHQLHLHGQQQALRCRGALQAQKFTSPKCGQYGVQQDELGEKADFFLHLFIEIFF